MNRQSRRELLADIGRGMLVAGLGSTTALELGLAEDVRVEDDQRLTFGELEPLVSLMQEQSPDRLLPQLVEQLRSGTSLKTLVTSAALANVRAFGGQDYTGFHTFMALVPAFQMAGELPESRQALPVLKVLYRNSSRIHDQQVHHQDAIHPISADQVGSSVQKEESLRERIRAVDWEGSEEHFASLAKGKTDEAFHQLQLAVQDEIDVHRVVLSWRAWSMLSLSGERYAHTLLRQSVRYCLNTEQRLRDGNGSTSPIRTVLPRLLDEYSLLSRPLGNRQADDAWVEHLAQTIFRGTREQAADAAAAALAEGMQPEAVGEAVSMAANLLVLHDPGRLEKYSTAEKPPGCVHGDSIGVHASDAANAWRNIARVSSSRNRIASLIVGAFHTAGQAGWVTETPYQYDHLKEEIRSDTAESLIAQTDEAIRANDQARACAIVARYGELDLELRPMLDLMLDYAISEDGALHAEKYYRTVTEEYAATRPTFRWRQIVALARVTASEHGFPAPGYAEACDLLGLA